MGTLDSVLLPLEKKPKQTNKNPFYLPNLIPKLALRTMLLKKMH